MRASVLLLLVATTLATGCATTGGRQQRIAVDSSPRGLEVRDAEGAVVGRTPLVVQVHRGPNPELTIRSRGQDHPVPLTCDLRWGTFLLGNAGLGALTAAGFGFGLPLGMAVDWWTGAAHGCPDRARVVVPAPTVKPPQCRVIGVLPPPHPDYAEQDRIARAWAASVRSDLGPCDRVVPTKTLRPLLTRLGLNPDPPEVIDRARLNRLAYEAGVTHLVRLRWDPRDGGTSIRGDLEDVHTEHRVDAPEGFDPAPPPDDSFSWRSLFRYLSLLPNSVAFAPSVTQPRPIARDGFESVDLEYHASLPALATGWTLTSAEHPDQFDAWDAHWKVSPSAGLGVLDVTWTAHATEGGVDLASRSTTWFIRGYAELGGVIHTPGGALDLSLLLGGVGVYQEELGTEASAFTGRFESGAALTYTAFMGERLFMRLAGAAFQTRNPTIDHPAFQVSEYPVATLALGYYLPETRWWLRSAFE